MDTAKLSVVADICRRAAADLARQGYKPDGEKVLRRFGLNEICRHMLPTSPPELRRLLKENPDWPQGHLIRGQPFLTLEEVNTVRRHLQDSATRQPSRTRDAGGETKPPSSSDAVGHAKPPSSSNAIGQAKIVTLCNFKGGVSKTTTAAHLAMAAALDGLNVLVVDLDSQASMSTLFGETAKDETETAYALMAWDRARAQQAGALERVDPALSEYLGLSADDLIRPTHWPTIDILPAQLNLYWAEFQIPVWLQSSRGWRFWEALGNFLTAEKLLDDYDLVIVDTPPALGYLTINALAAADILLVPVGASFIEFDSTGRFFDMLATTFSSIEETLASTHDTPPKFQWDAVQVLLTRYDDAQQGELGDLIEAYLGDMVSPHRQIDTALVGQAGERVSGIYEAPLADFNPQTYRRGRETFDASWAVLKDLLNAAHEKTT
ncbi:MAG: AAA family ATPase [Pseudomonadota bacterium]